MGFWGFKVDPEGFIVERVDGDGYLFTFDERSAICIVLLRAALSAFLRCEQEWIPSTMATYMYSCRHGYGQRFVIQDGPLLFDKDGFVFGVRGDAIVCGPSSRHIVETLHYGYHVTRTGSGEGWIPPQMEEWNGSLHG